MVIDDLAFPHTHNANEIQGLQTASYDDTFLRNGLTTETNSRIAGDNDLSSRIDAIPGQIDSRIQTVIGTAPAALDTLGEIATALQAGESTAAALTTSVSNIDNRVKSLEIHNTASRRSNQLDNRRC